MDSHGYLSKFQEQLAQARAQKEPPVQESVSTVPEFLHGVGLEDADEFQPDGFDEIIDNIGILEAYDKFIGKKRAKPRPGQTESIMVTCPWHDEKSPSAWVNTKKNLLTCGHDMSIGGDVITLAGIHFNMDPQEKREFPKLRKLIAEAFGFSIIKVGREEIAVPPASREVIESKPVLSIVPPLIQPDNVIQIIQAADEDELENNIIYPTLDWRQIVSPGTFLDIYMTHTTIDAAPEEYHFWNAMMALGLAGRRDIYLADRVPVFGNLFICLLGQTGNLKSTATGPFLEMIDKAFPYQEDDDKTSGIQILPEVGSGEILVKHFSKPVFDPNFVPSVGNRQPPVIGYAPVNGVVEFPEMAGLMKKANSSGSTLIERLIQLYDNRRRVTHSAGGSGLSIAHEPFCACLTTSQPKALRKILTTQDADSGFLNRWLFVSGNKKPRKIINTERVNIIPAVEELQRIRGWMGLRHLIVGFDADNDEAYDLFERFILETVDPIVEKDETGFYNRLELTYKKILLLLAINEKTQIITTEMVKKLYIFHEYLMKSLEIPGKHIGTFETNDLADKILEKVKHLTKEVANGPAKTLEGPTSNEVRRYIYPKPELAMFQRVFDILLSSQAIESYQSQGKRGRKTFRFLAVGE